MPIPEGEIGVGGKLRSTYLNTAGNPGALLDPGEIEGVPTDNSGLGLVFRPNEDGTFPNVTDEMVTNGARLITRNGFKRATRRHTGEPEVVFNRLRNQADAPLTVPLRGGGSFQYWGAYPAPDNLPQPTANNQRAYTFPTNNWYISITNGAIFQYQQTGDDGVPINFRGKAISRDDAIRHIIYQLDLIYFDGYMQQAVTYIPANDATVNEWSDEEQDIPLDETMQINADNQYGISESFKIQVDELSASQYHSNDWALDRIYRSEHFFGVEGTDREIVGMDAFEGNPIAIDSTGRIGVFGGTVIEPSNRADLEAAGVQGLGKSSGRGFIAVTDAVHFYSISSENAWTFERENTVTGIVDLSVPEDNPNRLWGLRIDNNAMQIVLAELLNGEINGQLLAESFTLATLQAEFPDSGIETLDQVQAISSHEDVVLVYCHTEDHSFTLPFQYRLLGNVHTLTEAPEMMHRTGHSDRLSGATLREEQEFIASRYIVRRYDRISGQSAVAGRVNIEDAPLTSEAYEAGMFRRIVSTTHVYLCRVAGTYTATEIESSANWWNITQAGTGDRGPAGTDAYSSRLTAAREEPAQGVHPQFRLVDVSPGIQAFTFRTLGAANHALVGSILSGTKIQTNGQVFTANAAALTLGSEVAVQGSWDTEPVFFNGTGYAILITQARPGGTGPRGLPGLDGSGTALTDDQAVDPDDEANTGTVTGDQLDKAIQANSPFTPERQSFLSDLGNFIVQHPDHNLRLEVTLHGNDFFGNETRRIHSIAYHDSTLYAISSDGYANEDLLYDAEPVIGGAARDDEFWFFATEDLLVTRNLNNSAIVTGNWRAAGEDNFESVCLGVDVNLTTNRRLYQIVYNGIASAFLRIYLINSDGTLTLEDNIEITDQSIFDALDPTYRLFPRVIVSLNSDFESQRGIGSIGIVDTTIYIPIGDVERLSTGRKLTRVLAYTMGGSPGSRTLTLNPELEFELPIGALSPDGIIIFTDGSLWVGFHHTLLRFLEMPQPEPETVLDSFDFFNTPILATLSEDVDSLNWYEIFLDNTLATNGFDGVGYIHGSRLRKLTAVPESDVPDNGNNGIGVKTINAGGDNANSSFGHESIYLWRVSNSKFWIARGRNNYDTDEEKIPLSLIKLP